LLIIVLLLIARHLRRDFKKLYEYWELQGVNVLRLGILCLADRTSLVVLAVFRPTHERETTLV
jgi:hypothetical protein